MFRSYTLSDEGGAGECGSQLSSASSSSCYTVNRIGKEDNEDFRGSVTIRVTTGNGIPVGKDKEQEERRSRFEQEKGDVGRREDDDDPEEEVGSGSPPVMEAVKSKEEILEEMGLNIRRLMTGLLLEVG